jgi:uncharacterized membrane protein
MKLFIIMLTLGMPVSFTGFSGTSVIIIVAILAAVQGIKYLRNRARHTN